MNEKCIDDDRHDARPESEYVFSDCGDGLPDLVRLRSRIGRRCNRRTALASARWDMDDITCYYPSHPHRNQYPQKPTPMVGLKLSDHRRNRQ